MTFLSISGFYPEPNPDNSLYYEKDVPPELEEAVLAAMGWASQEDVPPGETDLSQDQASAVMGLLGDHANDELTYSIGVFR